MKLTVPTNWQDDLVSRVQRPQVDTIFGKLREDFVGGGRPSVALPKITKNNRPISIRYLWITEGKPTGSFISRI